MEKNFKSESNTKTITVGINEAREWYNSGNEALKQIALKLFEEDELKYSYPLGWVKICNSYTGDYFFRNGSRVHEGNTSIGLNPDEAVDTLPTKDLLDAHTAMGQLLFAHHVWTEGWEPRQHTKDSEPLYFIASTLGDECRIIKGDTKGTVRPLYFKDKDTAEVFASAFKYLLCVAHGLY